jgi:cation diffusion facilitator family transporter
MVTPVPTVTLPQRAQERSIEFALALDALMIALFIVAAFLAGSLTMAAELTRGALMFSIEVFALGVMRRIHRGRTAMFEFGSGRLEQLVNLIIAGGLLAGAAWIGVAAVRRIAGGETAGTPIGFALAAVATSTNLYVNVLAWDAMRRTAGDEGSLIMQGQLRARIVKLVSSVCVQVSLTIAAVSPDPVVIVWTDSLGALVVCAFIVHAAVGMIRSDLPDLVDRSVHEVFQAAINRMLIRHFDDYERLDRVRTRRSGRTVHAEITLGFSPTLPMADVAQRIDAMKASLREELGDADIAIVAVAA